MSNFEFYTPTHVYFGRDTQRQVGDLVRAQGCKKVLVHFGGQSARRSGLLDQIEASLDAAGVAHVQLGGVVPNPHLSLVYQGIDLCKKEGVDFILAVGGGSVIDSAKAIGYGLCMDGDVWDLVRSYAQGGGLHAHRRGADHRRLRQRNEQFLRHHQGGRRHQARL